MAPISVAKTSLFAQLDADIAPVAPQSLWFKYRMRWKRRRLLFRSFRHRHDLTRLNVDEAAIAAAPILGFMTLRNEMARLPFYLDYYRRLGVGHFLVVDNKSDDGSADFLAQQPDVSVWTTSASYKLSRFGVDWLTCLQFKFGAGKWCLTADADENLVLPDNRSLPELTTYLDQAGIDSFGVLMLDMYPKGPVNEARYTAGDDPFKGDIRWFDADNYRAQRHRYFDNLILRGGVRDRLFFGAEPNLAPSLNKTPLVKWQRGFAYISSSHQILPRHLNCVYEAGRPTGVFLHSKFLPNIGAKSQEELSRQQHFENSDLYVDYYKTLIDSPDLWYDDSVEYTGPDQLENLGLMTRGSWA